MAKQSFTLAALLDHRQRIEDQRQVDHAHLQTRLALADGEVRLAELAHQACLAELRALQEHRALHIPTLRAGQMRVMRTEGEIARLRAAREVLAIQVEAARKAAVAASQDRLALERLEETYVAGQQQEAQHREAERLGEIGLARWIARQEGGKG